MYLRYFGVYIFIRIPGLFKFTSCVFILYSSNCFRVLVFCQWICSDRRIVANILLRQGWWNTFTRYKWSEFGTCGTVEKARRQNATGWTKNTGPKYTNTCYTNKKLKINTMSWLTVFYLLGKHNSLKEHNITLYYKYVFTLSISFIRCVINNVNCLNILYNVNCLNIV